MRLDHLVAVSAFRVTRHQSWLATAALTVQSSFTTAPMTAYAAAVVTALLAGRRWRHAGVVAVTMLITPALTILLKLAVDRPRPRWHDPITTLASASFPSGHSSSIAAAAALAVLLPLARHPGARRLVRATALTVALVVGADRLLLGVHYLSDVIAGYALGSLIALVLARLIRWSYIGPEPATSG